MHWFLRGLASIGEGMVSILSFGTYPERKKPKFPRIYTDEEAFAADREAITRDFEAVFGPRDTWHEDK